jgi:hypothetical protein
MVHVRGAEASAQPLPGDQPQRFCEQQPCDALPERPREVLGGGHLVSEADTTTFSL